MITKLSTLLPVLLVCSVMAQRIRVYASNGTSSMLSKSELDSLADMKVVVDGSKNYIYPETPSSFTIPTLPRGIHTVEILSQHYYFPTLIIEKRNNGVVNVKEYLPLTDTIKDEKVVDPNRELVIHAIGRVNYIEVESSPIMGFLMGNGTFIMMAVMMFMCYKGMGKLSEAQLAPGAAIDPTSVRRTRAD